MILILPRQQQLAGTAAIRPPLYGVRCGICKYNPVSQSVPYIWGLGSGSKPCKKSRCLTPLLTCKWHRQEWSQAWVVCWIINDHLSDGPLYSVTRGFVILNRWAWQQLSKNKKQKQGYFYFIHRMIYIFISLLEKPSKFPIGCGPHYTKVGIFYCFMLYVQVIWALFFRIKCPSPTKIQKKKFKYQVHYAMIQINIFLHFKKIVFVYFCLFSCIFPGLF